MRVIYRHKSQVVAESYLRKIETDDFEVSSVSTFGEVMRLCHVIGSEPILIVIEQTREEFKQVLDLIEKINSIRKDANRLGVAVLVLSMVKQQDAIVEAYESRGAFYMLRREPDAVLEKLGDMRRFLRRIRDKTQIRIVVVNRKITIWITGRDGHQHQFDLSTKLGLLFVFLARNRYANKRAIAEAIRIGVRSVKTYVQRLRDAYDEFNSDALHLDKTGREIFQTVHYIDEDIYRIIAKVSIVE